MRSPLPPKIVVRYIAYLALGAMLVIGLVLVFVRRKVDTKIRVAHTEFAFRQIREAEIDFSTISNMGDLVSGLERIDIDWNSCRVHGGLILDAWGREIQIDRTEFHVSLTSAGFDGAFETEDDISIRVERHLSNDNSQFSNQ